MSDDTTERVSKNPTHTARRLAIHATKELAELPIEVQGVEPNSGGDPILEYQHTTTDPAALESAISQVVARVCGVIVGMNPPVDRVEVVGYSPVEPDEVALDYHIRSEWAEAAAEGEQTAEEVLETVAEHAEEFVDIGGNHGI